MKRPCVVNKDGRNAGSKQLHVGIPYQPDVPGPADCPVRIPDEPGMPDHPREFLKGFNGDLCHGWVSGLSYARKRAGGFKDCRVLELMGEGGLTRR